MKRARFRTSWRFRPGHRCLSPPPAEHPWTVADSPAARGWRKPNAAAGEVDEGGKDGSRDEGRGEGEATVDPWSPAIRSEPSFAGAQCGAAAAAGSHSSVSTLDHETMWAACSRKSTKCPGLVHIRTW